MVSWKLKLLWYATTPCPVWRYPKPAHPHARKARKPSLHTIYNMCPQQQRRMLNSLLLTRLSVNSYNPVIDPFSMPLAHRPSAYEEMRSIFFLGKFDILSPDEIERLAEKLVTLYQDDIEQRFSNELLQFVAIRMSSSITRKTPLIYDTSFIS